MHAGAATAGPDAVSEGTLRLVPMPPHVHAGPIAARQTGCLLVMTVVLIITRLEDDRQITHAPILEPATVVLMP